MTVKVAINGFGRIGRLVARAIIERNAGALELVAINDLADAKSNAWLFSRDSVHGKYPGTVTAEGECEAEWGGEAERHAELRAGTRSNCRENARSPTARRA